MPNFYNPRELAERLETIPSITVADLEQIVRTREIEETVYTAGVHIKPATDEYDDEAINELVRVLENTPHWKIYKDPIPRNAGVYIDFHLQDDLPTAVLDKYNLV